MKTAMKISGAIFDVLILLFAILSALFFLGIYLNLIEHRAGFWHQTGFLLLSITAVLVVVFKAVELFSPEKLKSMIVRGFYWASLALVIFFFFLLLIPMPRLDTGQGFNPTDRLLSKYSLRFRPAAIPLRVESVWTSSDSRNRSVVSFQVKNLSKQKILYVEYIVLGPECFIQKEQQTYVLVFQTLRYGKKPFIAPGPRWQKPEPPIAPGGLFTLSIPIEDLEDYQRKAKTCSSGDTYSDLFLRDLILEDHSGWKGYFGKKDRWEVRPFLPRDMKEVQQKGSGVFKRKTEMQFTKWGWVEI